MYSTAIKRSRNNEEQVNEVECPICYEKINNTNEIVFRCSNCKKEFGLSCILKSCRCYWNKNETCKCPFCRVALNDNSMLIEIYDIEKKLDSLWKRYQDNIDRAIQNSYSMGNSDISNINDTLTLDEIRKLQDTKAKIIHEISLRNFIPDYENPLSRRGGRRYKSKKFKKTKHTKKLKKSKTVRFRK